MKPTSPQQLARLLDQVGGLYPNGIPVTALVSSAPIQESSDSPTSEKPAQYHFFVVGVSELSPANAALLEGIASKGLRLSSEEFRTSFVSESEVASEVSRCASERVIVFGPVDGQGIVERLVGAPALITYSLERLSVEPTLKRELWRSLQDFLTPS